MNHANPFPPSPHDLQTDAIVVGDSMSGISIAYEIATAGKKVILIGTGNTAAETEQDNHPVDFIGRDMQETKRERVDAYMLLPDADRSADATWNASLRKAFKLKKITRNLLSVHIVRASVSIHDFARFYPAKYKKGLCAIIENNGGVMLSQTYLQQVIPGGITTDKGFRIHAPNVFIATETTVAGM